MYYRDLTSYRTGDVTSEEVSVFPGVKNVGWLGLEGAFTTGDVDLSLVAKLKEILFLELKYAEDRRMGRYEPKRAVLVHTMLVRGSPHRCQLCTEERELRIPPGGLRYYTGNKSMPAGISEVWIPASKPREFYAFPTLLHHYIVEHHYRPPQEFLDALEAFDLDKPFDLDEATADLEVIDIPAAEFGKLRDQY